MRHRAGKKRPSNLQTCLVENRRFDTVGRQQNTRNATQPNDYRAIERELRRKTGKGTPQTRLGLSPIRRMERRRLRRARRRRRGRPHHEGGSGAGGAVLDVDARLRASRAPTPTHRYAATRQTAMSAFAKSWRRNEVMQGAYWASKKQASSKRALEESTFLLRQYTMLVNGGT